MHIVAADPRPKGVSINDIPQDVIDKERNFRITTAMESGKPKEIAEKMVEGGMAKFYEEVALLEQPFILDQTKKIKDLVGAKASLLGYFRHQVGEQAIGRPRLDSQSPTRNAGSPRRCSMAEQESPRGGLPTSSLSTSR